MHQAALAALGPTDPAAVAYAATLAEARVRRDAARSAWTRPAKGPTKDVASKDMALKEATEQLCLIEELYATVTDRLEHARAAVEEAEAALARARDAQAAAQTVASATSAAALISSIVALLADLPADPAAEQESQAAADPVARAMAALRPLRGRLQQVGDELAAAVPGGPTGVATQRHDPRTTSTVHITSLDDPCADLTDGDGDSTMFATATTEQLQAALAPITGSLTTAPPTLADGDGVPRDAPGGGGCAGVYADGGVPLGQMRVACQNLLRLRRLSTTPYGDGPQGQVAVAKAPPRG